MKNIFFRIFGGLLGGLLLTIGCIMLFELSGYSFGYIAPKLIRYLAPIAIILFGARFLLYAIRGKDVVE